MATGQVYNITYDDGYGDNYTTLPMMMATATSLQLQNTFCTEVANETDL